MKLLLRIGADQQCCDSFGSQQNLAIHMRVSHAWKFRGILIIQKDTRTQQRAPISPPQPLACTDLLSLPMDLPLLDSSCKSNHSIDAFLCLLLSLGIMFLKFFHTGNIANNITFSLRVLLSCFLISNLSFPENVRFTYSGVCLSCSPIAPSLPRNEHYTHRTLFQWMNG